MQNVLCGLSLPNPESSFCEIHVVQCHIHGGGGQRTPELSSQGWGELNHREHLALHEKLMGFHSPSLRDVLHYGSMRRGVTPMKKLIYCFNCSIIKVLTFLEEEGMNANKFTNVDFIEIDFVIFLISFCSFNHFFLCLFDHFCL